ncbi:MAG: M23 family metallopeptidase [Leptolyngbya sp. UWPOB_LEPTO1]|uniref:M23 family metallopeptidase n=1 Tax=Leptolyngbya sp. UWPOB_LEPTO1 TaxID=2815653 RepID=UPI001AC8CFA3|nr:M23 family metallopeptidase [Leptolyngbya sp. UWPOB_LEPTO1]MBN8564209.1 M23 family metallopeptidase [Leptolyngbya sp. UWPOB_LEPTO1]
MRWFRFLTPIVLTVVLVVIGAVIFPQRSDAAESYFPTTLYNSAPVPDLSQTTFSSLPAIEQAGAVQVPSQTIEQLGYDPSRSWQAGASIGDVLMLGDTQDTFGLQTFSLDNVAQLGRLNLGNLSLSNFPLIRQQTIATLVDAVPMLENFQLGQVKPLSDLVNQSLAHLALKDLNLNDWGATSLSAIASHDVLGQLPLSELSLNRYSFSQIPGLDQVPLSNFKAWQTALINGIPGLSQVAFSQFPINPFQMLGAVAIHDVTYGGERSHKESTQNPTKFSITGSDKVGFHYSCAQAGGCDYIELNSPGYSGSGALSDPGQLHGARWIRGGKEAGEQMVPGGRGVLGRLNSGMEPTGRLAFGKAFKVVLTDTDEATGTGRFGLYFRVCIKKAFVNLGCTPYFIGPVPWLSTQEKGFVFVGLADGNGGMDELPPGTELPPEVQQQIDQIKGENSPEANLDGSGLCGSGPGGVDFKALADATSGIEGNYSSVGQWGCDGDGNCGRGLGRYQFMTYREDVKQAVLRQPGGSAFYGRLAAGHEPSSAELLQYFPTSVQDSLFVNAETQNIKYLQSRGKSGNELIACLGEMWYSGECSHSGGRDYTGGPTISEYGQILVSNYQKALKRSGGKSCSINAKGGGKSTGKLSSPVSNAPVTSEFGARSRPCAACSTYHLGLDFGVPDGTPVKAADGGKIIYSGWMQGYGNTVVVDHGNGLMTLYAHNSQLRVKVGDTVSQGQIITESGHSGVGTGSHLHFTVIEGATPGDVYSGHEVDPRKYLRL